MTIETKTANTAHAFDNTPKSECLGVKHHTKMPTRFRKHERKIRRVYTLSQKSQTRAPIKKRRQSHFVTTSHTHIIKLHRHSWVSASLARFACAANQRGQKTHQKTASPHGEQQAQQRLTIRPGRPALTAVFTYMHISQSPPQRSVGQ